MPKDKGFDELSQDDLEEFLIDRLNDGHSVFINCNEVIGDAEEHKGKEVDEEGA